MNQIKHQENWAASVVTGAAGEAGMVVTLHLTCNVGSSEQKVAVACLADGLFAFNAKRDSELARGIQSNRERTLSPIDRKELGDFWIRTLCLFESRSASTLFARDSMQVFSISRVITQKPNALARQCDTA